jgi:hypothetical protein
MREGPSSRRKPGSSVFLFLLGLLPALAFGAESSGDQLSISLLTFSPGDIYWERFGHNAILVRDAARGEEWTYNYGLFDFEQEHFFLNFARGRMRYRLGAIPLAPTLEFYRREGRGVVEQHLALAPAQRARLDAFLRWNAQPENADYGYDYFRDNCSTRVRDALDRALGGALRRALAGQPAGITYRSETVRLLWPDHLLALGMDLAMGPAGDKPVDQWDAAFIPLRLMDSLRAARVRDDSGAGQPLVSGEDELLPALLPDPPPRVPPIVMPFLLAGLLIAGALAALARLRQGTALGLLGGALLVVTGLAGVILAAMWGLTAHWGAWRDAMLLLVNPLALLLLPQWWRVARQGSRRVAGLAAVVLLMAVASVPLALFGIGAGQWHWIVLLLPIHGALAYVLLRPAAA